MSGDGSASLGAGTAFSFLLGTWTLEREIVGQAKMTGQAEVLETAAGGAVFRERVAVTMRNGAEFRGSQSYRIRRTGRGFDLLFAETGELFQALQFCRSHSGALRAHATHVCGEDMYVSAYRLGPGRCFLVQHAVTGPRKRYRSRTIYAAAVAG